MEDELWMKKIKKRLEDYSEPIPASGWERLEKELSVSTPSIAGKRRFILLRRRAVAAAAVLLVAVSSISLWLLQSPVGDEVRRANVSVLTVAPDILSERTTPETPVSIHSLVAQHIEIPTRQVQKEELASSETLEVANDFRDKETVAVQTEKTEVKQVEEPENRQMERRRPSGKSKLQLPVGRKSSSKSGGWSIGLGMGNTGGLGNALKNGGGQYGPAYDYGVSSGKLDLMATADGIVSIPEGQEVFFKDGLPYLRKRERSIESIDHKQPLSFGLSVRKNLAKGFSVETGLTYTYLASDVKFDDNSEKFSQKLHYIGIPVRANWNFVDKKSFTMYISAGGAVEKCVYGKIGSDSETVKPLQLSVMGAVGAQYNISDRVGVYVEPGVSYFFDDGSDVQTIRKENPCNFTLQAGIRLTY